MFFKKILDLVFVLNLCQAYLAQTRTCAKAAEFAECSNAANLQVAGCSEKVSDTPNKEFYSCMCNGYQSSLECYGLCPDDEMLLLQLKTQKENAASSCKAAGDMEKKEALSSSRAALSKTSSLNPSATTKAINSVKKVSSSSIILASGGSAAASPTGPTGSSVPLIPFFSEAQHDQPILWSSILLFFILNILICLF